VHRLVSRPSAVMASDDYYKVEIEGVLDQTLFSKEELIEKFGWEEYFIFALMLAVSACIGIYYWRKGQDDNGEFLLGGKSMGVFPMTMSLVASFMSAITLLGTPSEVYQNGTQYCLLVLAYPFVMFATAYFYMPVFYNLNVSTSYEYLEWRFNKAVRVLGACCFILQMVLYMAIVVYAPALALSQLTGFDVDIACAVIFAVCIFYTSIGGIKAVMWTDAFQGIMMFGSFLAVIIKGNYDAGGASLIFDRNYQTGRIELFNFDPRLTTRHTVWAMIIGGYFTWVSVFGINQTQVQRYLTSPDKQKVVKSIWLSMIGIGSLLLMCSYAGLVIFTYYDIHQCDPIKAKLVEKGDQLFPLFVMQVMGDVTCIPGLFVAGVFSGALSTVSSGLNSLAAVVLQDLCVSAANKKFSERTKIILTKSLAAGFGCLSYLVVFLVKYIDGVLAAALGIFGIVGGPVLGGFTLGMFVPWANSLGAFVGMFSSLIFTMWFGFGQTVAKNFGTYDSGNSLKPTSVESCPSNIYNATSTISTTMANDTMMEDPDEYVFPHVDIYNVSYMWFSAIPCMWTIVVGSLVSLYKPQDPKTLMPELISPAFRKLFTFWPKPVINFIDNLKIGCNYVQDEKYHRIKGQQIMMNNNPPDGVGHENEKMKHYIDPNQTKGEQSGVNLAFEMNERL